MSAVDKRRICPQIGQCTKLTIAVALTLLFSLATRIAVAADGDADLGDNPWTMCAKATNRIERQEGIPRQLLRAISKMESGRWHSGKQLLMAGPWTLMAERQRPYLPT